MHGRVWTFAIVGMKGDMKWHADLGNLLRHHGTRGKRRPLMMCPECHAGSAGMPYEDISESPAWMGSLYQTRPWEARHPLADCPFDPICPEKIHKRRRFSHYKTWGFPTLCGFSAGHRDQVGLLQDGAPS